MFKSDTYYSYGFANVTSIIYTVLYFECSNFCLNERMQIFKTLLEHLLNTHANT